MITIHLNHRGVVSLYKVCGLWSYLRLAHLFLRSSKQNVDFPTKKHNQTLESAFCVCVCACVCSGGYTCVCWLLSRPRCLVFYRDHSSFTATSFTATVQVWHIVACMRRDKSSLLSSDRGLEKKYQPNRENGLCGIRVFQNTCQHFEVLRMC